MKEGPLIPEMGSSGGGSRAPSFKPIAPRALCSRAISDPAGAKGCALRRNARALRSRAAQLLGISSSDARLSERGAGPWSFLAAGECRVQSRRASCSKAFPATECVNGARRCLNSRSCRPEMTDAPADNDIARWVGPARPRIAVRMRSLEGELIEPARISR
jgi:hypothetical protein